MDSSSCCSVLSIPNLKILIHFEIVQLPVFTVVRRDGSEMVNVCWISLW